MKTRNLIAGLLTGIMAAAALAGCGGAATTSSTSSDSSTSASKFNADSEITVVSRENGSGTRGAFIELMGIEEKGADGTKVDKTTSEAVIANKTDVMLTNVSGDEYGIGYVSLGSLSSSVKAVDVDGVEATAENIKNGTYKVARPFNIATKAEISDVAQDFIDFILSADGQEIVSNGYIKVDDNAAPYAGTKLLHQFLRVQISVFLFRSTAAVCVSSQSNLHGFRVYIFLYMYTHFCLYRLKQAF